MSYLTIPESFLNQLREAKQTVVVYLINGVRLRGRVEDFDDNTLLLVDEHPLLVYRHAIGTIMGMDT